MERAPFERFITQSTEEDRYTEELEALNERKEELRDKEEARINLQAEVKRDEDRLENLEERTQEAQSRYEKLDEAVDQQEQVVYGAAEAEQDEAPHRGSLIYAALFTVAGAFFLGGDIIMSREVVAKALRLEGFWEPWIFAIGLAMLAVAMKPAYDRLVEKPYWEGKRAHFRWTILAVTLAAAVTLGVLGAFRSEAFVNQRAIEHLQNEMMVGDLSAKEMASMQNEVTSLQQATAESSLGFFSFILSGVLFAMAGAVCLGIGFRHGRDWYHRRRLPKKRLKELEQEKSRAEAALKEARSRLTAFRAEFKAKRERLHQMEPLEAIRKALEEIREEQRDMRAARAVGRRNKYIEIYRNGYNLADARLEYESGNGAADPDEEELGISMPGSSTKQNGQQEEDSARPFIALRKAISRNSAS